MAKYKKRVTLHPLNIDGSIDLNTNLYPKTFLDGIVDRDGNQIDVATKEELEQDVTTLENKKASVFKAPWGINYDSIPADILEAVKTGDTIVVGTYLFTVISADEEGVHLCAITFDEDYQIAVVCTYYYEDDEWYFDEDSDKTYIIGNVNRVNMLDADDDGNIELPCLNVYETSDDITDIKDQYILNRIHTGDILKVGDASHNTPFIATKTSNQLVLSYFSGDDGFFTQYIYRLVNKRWQYFDTDEYHYSDVIANPTLVGNEDVLTSVKINDSKYRLPALDKMISITHKELVKLRDSKQLVPGQQYRITDYVTTTIQPRTQSAGHQFDVIVVADDVDKLNEHARACDHISSPVYDVTFADDVTKKCYIYFTGEDSFNVVAVDTLLGESDIVYDECSLVDKINKVIIITAYYSTDMRRSNITYNYFESSKVESWQLKYCLDNDTSRFVWADNTQQITNLRSACSEGRPLTRQPSFDNRNTNPSYLEYQYAWGTSDDVFDGDNTNFIYSKNETVENDELVLNMSIYGDEELQNAQVEERGKGVIYYLKDEFENECPYDFKNIQFARYKITACENCDMLVGKYYGVISNQSYEKLLPNFLDFDDNDYKYFYTFDLYQTDYSLNAIGRTFTRPDGSSFTLDQIQCCKCVLRNDEADSSKFYLSNNVVLLESSRDCRLVVNGWCTSNTFLGGSGGIDFFNVYGNIIGATSTDFIDGYVGYNSHINRISNSLVISHNYYALMESKIGEIRDSCLIGGNRGAIAVSDVTTIEHCVLSANVAIIAQSQVGVLHDCNIKCTDIAIIQSTVQVAYYLSGEGATNFFYRSVVGFVNTLSMSTNDIARPFINRGHIQYIYEGSFKYIADSEITSLLYSNLQIVNGCKFIHNSYLTCDQDLVGCTFDHNVSYLNISSTDTTQAITNTNFHDIRGVDVDNIKNVVIPEDYSTIHTVDIYAPGHNTIEIA